MSPILGIWASQISGHLWAPQGAYDALATVTVGSGGASSIDLVGIPSGYKHLQIRMLQLGSVATNSYMQFNGDTGSNYYFHELYGQGTNAYSTASGSVNYIKASYVDSSSANYVGASIIDILDYSSTVKNKVTRNLTGSDSNGSGYIIQRPGLWLNTSAITSIKIYPASGSFNQYTQVALYGVK